MAKYTDDELIEFYKKFGLELGRAPSQNDVNERRKYDKDYPSSTAFSRRFGFSNLAKICGFEVNRKDYSQQQLLDILKDYFHNKGIPTNDDFDSNPELPSSWTYGKFFGGIRKALIQVGLIEETVNFSIYQNMSDEDILNLVREFYQKNNSIRVSDFVARNSLPSGNYIRKRFGSFDIVYEKCGIPIDPKYFSKYKKASDEILLERLKWYCENIGFPTNRSLLNNPDMPSYNLYYYRFGDIRNALNIIGIEIPEERLCHFDRECLSDEEMLRLLKEETNKRISDSNLPLLTYTEIDEHRYLPSQAAYYSRFGILDNLYSLIGYDYQEFNARVKRKDMVDKYLEIRDELNRTPSSRDIERFSREHDGSFNSMSSYEFHFGSLTGLQQTCGLTPTGSSRLKTREDLIKDLQRLQAELHRTPVMVDLFTHDYMCSPSKYFKEFGSFHESLIAAGMKPNVDAYFTTNGTKCLSHFELRITEWFEKNNVNYQKEVMYKKVLHLDDSLRRFDWVVKHNEKTFCIEMFGIVGNENYKIKTKKKIDDCLRNGINLVALYPDDLKKPLDEVFSFLLEENRVIS